MMMENENATLKHKLKYLEIENANLKDHPVRCFEKTIERKFLNLQTNGMPLDFKIILYWPTDTEFDEKGVFAFRTVSEFYRFNDGRFRVQLLKYIDRPNSYGVFIKIIPDDPMHRVKINRLLTVKQNDVILIQHQATDEHTIDNSRGKNIYQIVNDLPVEISVAMSSLELIIPISVMANYYQ